VAAVLVWAGVVCGMVAIGAVFALIAQPLGDFIRIVLPLADGLLILLGVLLLLGRNPFARLPQLSLGLARGRGPALGAFAYGLLFAPIAVPCSGPFIVSIFALSLTLGDVVSQLAFFLAFGIGFGVPLFVIGLLGQVRGTELARTLVRHERPIQVVLGVVLVAVGAWDLANNVDLLVG
jgi:cytochrome c-type biogenesis protein